MARRPDPGARERILEAASQLFAEHGIHAVGLQQIIDACGCGKNLLYREFGSKDDLVVAHLERCRRDWEDAFDAAAGAHPHDVAAQLVAVVATVAEDVGGNGFRGCSLRNAFSEFPDPGHPARKTIIQQYTERQERLRDLATRADLRDPHRVADRIALIIDGLNANGPVLGDKGAAAEALAFAEDVISAARRP